MHVEITREAKLAKLDHLFILIAEKGDLQIAKSIRAIASEVVKRSGFYGRSEETITVLEDEPHKVTLVGVGKEDEFSIRCLSKALGTVARTAQKQRDRRIAVAVGAPLRDIDAEPATRLTASMLAHADYKYDAFQTQKKDEKRIPINAMLIAPPSLDGKRLRDIELEADAITEGMRTVRDLGNAPPNVITPAGLAECAVEVSKKVGVKCRVYGRREIARMKMGGLLAVNRGSAEEPRFVVMEYRPR